MGVGFGHGRTPDDGKYVRWVEGIIAQNEESLQVHWNDPAAPNLMINPASVWNQ
jgi:hypothetical protein